MTAGDANPGVPMFLARARLRMSAVEGRFPLLLPLLAGIAMRGVLLLTVNYPVNTGDASGYHQLALNVARSGEYTMDAALGPYVGRAPLLPLFAGSLFSIFGERVLTLQLAQCAISLAAAWFFCSSVIRVEPSVRRLLPWVVFLSPSDALYAGAFLAEALATSFVFVAMGAQFLRVRARWLLVGAALGLATLARDVYLLLAPFLATILVVHAFRRRAIPERKGNVAAALLVVLGMSLTVAPWTYRNYTVTKRIVPVSQGFFWLNVWIGTWETTPLVDYFDADKLPPAAFWHSRKERVSVALAKDRAAGETDFRDLALERFREEPLAVGLRWANRVPRMWIGTRFELFDFRLKALRYQSAPWLALKISLFALNACVLLLSILGLRLILSTSSANGKSLLWLMPPVLYTALIYVPFHSTEPRYSQPVYPCLLALAAYYAANAPWARAVAAPESTK